MTKKWWKAVAVCLALCLSLTGCFGTGYLVESIVNQMVNADVKFSEMEYTRPDMEQLRGAMEECCRLAAESDDVHEIMDSVWVYYDLYDQFFTQMNIADIYYCRDMSDEYWQAEYNFCLEQSTAPDMWLEEIHFALAKSPQRPAIESDEYWGEGALDGYDGENIWDEAFLELMDQESALIGAYYDLTGQAMETEYYSEDYFEQYGTQMAQLFVELIALRQQIADYVGYDSYQQFAYDYYFYRPYTPDQVLEYTEKIRNTLVPLYRRANENEALWAQTGESYSEEDTLGYLQKSADRLGGVIKECFDVMKQRELYDISFGENKYDTSFELFLPSYYVPFVFTNPTGTAYDMLVFAHEFGHFCNDYLCGGSFSGTDVSEFFSQGMEYLTLCYGPEAEAVKTMKFADCLCVYVEQAAYASFEHQVYDLRGDDLTEENVQALYSRVCREFGFDSWDWDARDYVTVSHFFSAPMYVISYVVSNDAALQLYQMEQENPGIGLACYAENLYSQEQDLLTFLETAGLQNPFQPDRLETVKELLEDELN